MSENPQETAESVADESTGTETSAEETDTTLEGAESLGDPGKKALDAMKEKWRTERDQRRDLEARIAELEAPKTEGEPEQVDAEALRQAAREEARAEFAVQLEAKGRLANPKDVLRYSEYFKDVKADDPASITAAIDELLEENPHLAAKATPRFQGTADNGAHGRSSGPSQLTRDDLRGMSPAEVVKAKQEGRLKNLLGGS
ncbi:hypothetical protein ACQEU8_02510 [Streptomyces sp. CA-250714]|uniref:hypothetical protein n=1 Tax=Streptomyces sp. CA-250714 TaxID=3240060 RepID=UPI003D8DD48E